MAFLDRVFRSRSEERDPFGINLFNKQLGQEEAVDGALAVDMFRIQDYVARGVKDAGKRDPHISFQARNNELLPGGASRLDNVTDYHLRVPYERVKEFLLLDSETELSERLTRVK